MAKTLRARLTARLKDANSVVSSATAYVKLETTATTANINTVLTDWLTLLEACTAADITQGEVTILGSGSPIGDTNADFSDSNNEETCVVDFVVPSTGGTYGFAFPAYKDSLKVGGKIDPGAAAIVALAGGMGATTNADFYTNTNDALGDLKTAFRTTRKRLRHRG